MSSRIHPCKRAKTAQSATVSISERAPRFTTNNGQVIGLVTIVDEMGQVAGTLNTRDVGLSMDDKPTFDPKAGFTYERKQREMIAEEKHLISAKIPPSRRDYCAHVLLDYQVCRFKNMPMLYRCAHERHDYLNCEQQDYVIRMKEFERERRLRQRENRVATAA